MSDERSPFLTDDPCDCPDARAFRALLASPTGEGIMALASTLAVWKLRQLSHGLSQGADWTRPVVPYDERSRYDGPANPWPPEVVEKAHRTFPTWP